MFMITLAPQQEKNNINNNNNNINNNNNNNNIFFHSQVILIPKYLELKIKIIVIIGQPSQISEFPYLIMISWLLQLILILLSSS